ncbi:MAG: hypothetical protein ACLFRI_07380 [Candidatus Izemoplasmataceae bacterium]
MMDKNVYRALENTNSDIQNHKDELELKYLKKKIIIVNVMLLTLVAPLMVILYLSNIPVNRLLVYGLFMGVLAAVNIAFYAYDDYFNSLKLSVYITSLGIYMISITLIMELKTASSFTFLFIAYAIVSVYQDKKAALINNVSLLFFGIIFIWRYSDIFRVDNSNVEIFYIYVFLIVFVALLSVSSFIIINRKRFLYNKLAQIKESEIRLLGIIHNLKTKYDSSKLDYLDYVEKFQSFSENLVKKIDVDNVFEAQIQLLKDLENLKDNELNTKYPEYTYEEIQELKQLYISKHSKINYMLFKSSQVLTLKKDEKISSDNMFVSFNNINDSRYSKIIAFAVFYTLLKIDKEYFQALDDDTIKTMLQNTEFKYLLDPKIASIYYGNYEVFNKIFEDAFDKKVSL